MKEFWKNLTSIEEHKQSLVSYAFICWTIIGLWKTFRFGDIPSNIMYFLEFLTTGIIGYNVAKPLLNRQSGGENLTDANKKSEQ